MPDEETNSKRWDDERQKLVLQFSNAESYLNNRIEDLSKGRDPWATILKQNQGLRASNIHTALDSACDSVSYILMFLKSVKNPHQDLTEINKENKLCGRGSNTTK